MDYPSDPEVGLRDGKFTDGDPAAGYEASVDPAAWANAVTDEMLHVIQQAGLTPDETTLTQVRDAILRITSTQVTTITADTTLGLGHAGLVNVDASGGNVTLTLPPASTLPGLRYTILRTDNNGNSVTIAPDSGNPDTVIGEASLSLDEGESYELRADGQSDWLNLLEPALDALFASQRSLGNRGYQILPGGLILQWGSEQAPNGNDVSVIDFPIPYPSSVFMVVSSDEYTLTLVDGQAVHPKIIYKKDLLSFEVVVDAPTTGGNKLGWISLGR